MTRCKLALLGAAGLLAAIGASVGPAVAQEEFPARPVELIVPWGPGGGADQLARLVAKLAEPILGQGVPVVNVPGGTGATGMAKLLAAPADGYSMAIYIADSHALLAGENPRWTMEDIVPIAVLIQAPSFIFVAKDSAYETWADFEKAAKENPGQLKVATLGFGSVDDFTLKSLESHGIRSFNTVLEAERALCLDPGRPCRRALRAGRRHRAIPKSGEMRPLIVFGTERFGRRSPTCRAPASSATSRLAAVPRHRGSCRHAAGERRVLSDALSEVAASEEYKQFLKAQYAPPTSFLRRGAAPFSTSSSTT